MCEESEVSELSPGVDPLSPLFHEGAQNFKLINLSILPRWVVGFQAAEAKLVSGVARVGGRLSGWFEGMAGQIKVRTIRRKRHKPPSPVLDPRSFADRSDFAPPVR